MRILSVVGRQYYGRRGVIEPMYVEFTEPLRTLGHRVEHFDHAAMRRRFGLAGCGQQFVDRVRSGSYDLVLYQTAGQDWMERQAIGAACNYAPVVAWNSDDDWQWETYTRHLYPYFSFMVTTYPVIFQANRLSHPNLRLSQWGCYRRCKSVTVKKDLDFSFVGRFYGSRVQECRFLRKAAGLRPFGLGSQLVRLRLPYFRGALRLPWMQRSAMKFSAILNIWNRSRISYTPLGASALKGALQIKGRVFQMGVSRTLMLCTEARDMESYYEPYREYVPFRDLEECADKARYYLSHEDERARIAERYFQRTMADHLWEHRFRKLLAEIGLTGR